MDDTQGKETFVVDLEPVGRRADVEPGTSLLGAAQAAGVGLVSLCGGEGWCESCLIRLESGALSAPTMAERDVLSEDKFEAGYRLACQAIPLSDVRINIPPESLTTPQRLQIEGQEIAVAPDPPVVAVDVRLDPPTINDPRADATRLKDALANQGYVPVRLNLPVLTDLSNRLRAFDWSARLALRQDEVVGVLPPESRLLGLAVDVGTTKLATYLLDMVTGETVAKTSAMNPQIAYGEDVISRIAYTHQHDKGRCVLQGELAETLNEMIAEMCDEVATPREQVVEVVAVGNTAMHHLLAGLPVSQLGMAPYVPAVSDALTMRASDIGLNVAAGAYVHLLPNIAGYVGSDHVAVILATDVWQARRTVIALDIGTNTEITLATGGRLLSCSCASGPAFEGAHIRNGMRAAPGAIERVQIVEGVVHTHTISDKPPVGICGSGILDAVAEMRAAGILSKTGAFQEDVQRVRKDKENMAEYVLVSPPETGHGRAITVTRKDVNEIQLAKGAIRAGLEILMSEAGVEQMDVEEIIIAGAFGTYVDVANAIRVGMFPSLDVDRFRQVGNAAGMGAKQVLISTERRRIAAEIVRRVEYVELNTHPAFTDTFVKAMHL